MQITGPSTGSQFREVGQANGKPESVETDETQRRQTEGTTPEGATREVTQVPNQARTVIHQMGSLQEALRIVDEASSLLEQVL